MATVLPSALTAAITRPSLVARPDFLAALAIPFWRSQSTAFSRSPSTSTRAFLQSIMPAPVFSRSSFTIAAEIAIVFSCVSGLGRSKIPKKSRSAQGGGTARKPRRHLFEAWGGPEPCCSGSCVARHGASPSGRGHQQGRCPGQQRCPRSEDRTGTTRRQLRSRQPSAWLLRRWLPRRRRPSSGLRLPGRLRRKPSRTA